MRVELGRRRGREALAPGEYASIDGRPGVGTVSARVVESPGLGSHVSHYVQVVRRIIRPSGVLLTFVLALLVLVESGYACQVRMVGGSMDTAMAGMSMPGHPASPQPASKRHDVPQEPCRFPWAPNGCQNMAPCAPSALTVPSAENLSPLHERVELRALAVLVPLAPSLAPELPPPRA